MAGIFLPGSKASGTGDITTVDAGVGLSGGGDSGDVTLTLDLSELSTVTPINGDFFATLDSDGATEQKTSTTALATLFAGDGLTASAAALSVNVDDSTIETDSDAIRIKDDGVTAAKLFNLARGSVLIGNASAATAELTIGNNTYVLTSDGTDIAWAAASSGASLSGSTDNTVATVTGANALAGEANLTFDSNVLTVGASADIEPQIILQNDENSLQIGVANATDDMITGSADGDVVINSVGDHKVLIAQNDTLAITLDADGDVTFANNIDGGTWLGTTIAVNKGGTGATSLTNLITLATHTTGDYVQNITAGTGLTSTGATSGENIAHSLSVDASQTQITGVGTITTGVWQGDAVASAYLDADTAHLTTTQTFTGAKTFDENIALTKSITYDSTPANPSYSGVTATFTAGETLEAGEVVYLKAADTKMWKAVANTGGTGLVTAEIMCVAMAAEDITADNPGLFLLQGFLRDDDNFPTYAIGETLYVPEAEQGGQNVPEGEAPDTDGDMVQVIGWAADANTVYFSPNFTMVEVA